MLLQLPAPFRSIAVAVMALGLLLAACGDDDADDAAGETATDVSDDTESSDPSDEGDESEDDGGSDDISGSADDSDLVVPRDYLQGQWCSSDGNEWTIEGDTASFTQVSTGSNGQFPVDVLFTDGPDTSLVSQTDNEFVVNLGGDELTFTRGAC